LAKLTPLAPAEDLLISLFAMPEASVFISKAYFLLRLCGSAQTAIITMYILDSLETFQKWQKDWEVMVMKNEKIIAIVVGLLLVMGQVHAGKPGGKPPKEGGGGKGGFGELGNGCVTFIPGPNTNSFDNIHDDGVNPTYCNGTDGQVSIPVRLRVDTKKFNKEGRYYGFAYEKCGIGESWCNGGAELARGQMGNEFVLDINLDGEEVLVSNGGLDMTLMTPQHVTRVGIGFFIDNDHGLNFSSEYDEFGELNDRACFEDPDLGPSNAEPLWVRCEADVDSDELCDLWTVSTFELLPGGGFGFGKAQACLKNGLFSMLDPNVDADFTISICVMGTGACQ
jgi:hypothetical protein